MRRSALTPQTFTGPDVASTESVEAVDEVRPRVRSAKRKRRRGPGGLGRGLARILVEAGGTDRVEPGAGLVELVGGQSATRLATVETRVLDAALTALMAAFDLQALAVAAGPPADRPGDEALVRAMTPPDWPTDRGLGASLTHHLEALLARPQAEVEAGPSWREVPLHGHHLWLQGAVEDGRILAAAALGATPLPSSAAAVLGPAVLSLASSTTGRGVDPGLRNAIHASTQIALKSEGSDVLAEVNADWPLPDPVKPGLRGRRTGVGRGSEPVLAVARAAAKACRPRCEVLFAGTAGAGAGPDRAGDVGSGEVAVALVRHHRHGLRIGWAERARGDLGAVAEAVFTAAH